MPISITSPFRYPGSKRKLARQIQEIIQFNNVKPELFIEPFAGGASVSLQLLSQGVVEQIGLIEKDTLVASFWYELFFGDFNWLVEQINNIEVTLEKWNEFKQLDIDSCDHRTKAIAGLFLNRTNFSGIMTSDVGPIGGRDQTSNYHIDCRFPRETLVARMTAIYQLRNRVKFVYDGTWQKGIEFLREEQQNNNAPQNILFYFDPPFFKKANKLYRYFFSEHDHEILRDAIFNLNDDWILSYDDFQRAYDLYGGNIQGHVNIPYCIPNSSASNGRRVAKEVIFTNLNLPTRFLSQTY